MATTIDLKALEDDPRLYLYTSLSAGSSHIVTATNRIQTILKANRYPFIAVDLATNEPAKRLWHRRAGKRKLPGLVKEGFVLGDLNEIEEWNEFGELAENLGVPVPIDQTTATETAAPDPFVTQPEGASGVAPTEGPAQQIASLASQAADKAKAGAIGLVGKLSQSTSASVATSAEQPAQGHALPLRSVEQTGQIADSLLPDETAAPSEKSDTNHSTDHATLQPDKSLASEPSHDTETDPNPLDVATTGQREAREVKDGEKTLENPDAPVSQEEINEIERENTIVEDIEAEERGDLEDSKADTPSTFNASKSAVTGFLAEVKTENTDVTKVPTNHDAAESTSTKSQDSMLADQKTPNSNDDVTEGKSAAADITQNVVDTVKDTTAAIAAELSTAATVLADVTNTVVSQVQAKSDEVRKDIEKPAAVSSEPVAAQTTDTAKVADASQVALPSSEKKAAEEMEAQTTQTQPAADENLATVSVKD